MKKWFTAEIKFWKVMKICGVQSALAMILVGVSLAYDGKSQMLEKKITINLENVTLEVALREIATEAKVKFVYSNDQLDLKEKVSIDADQQPLGELLDDLLTLRQIKYKVHEKESAITLRRDVQREGGQSFRSRPESRAMPETITGTVTGGAQAEPLAGVNVIIKGTTVGTTTDGDGRFAIQAGDKDILVFSFIGYVSFETQVSGRSVIDVVLQEDAKNLNEVVVNAGYWTLKEKEKTGNISRITSEEIKAQPVSNFLQTMAGRMAGVVVTQETGLAGGGIQVQIRGRNSINSGNDPLYIVDGIPVLSTSLKSPYFGSALGNGNPLSTLNPNDIESIEVLKDGAATAIYGSRGANGVILITTKKSGEGTTKIDVGVSSGFSQVNRTMNLLNTRDYLTMRREAFKNDNRIPSTSNAADLLRWDTTRYTDWQKQLIGNTAHVTNFNLSISGGDKHTTFLLSVGFYKESTVFPGDFGYKRGTSNFSLMHKSSNERLQILFSANYALEDNKLFNGDLTNPALLLAPNAPEGYLNGQINWGPLSSFGSNPYAILLNRYNVRSNNLRTNAHIDYKIINGLQFKANLGYTRIQTESFAAAPVAAINPAFGVTTGSSNFGSGSNETWIVEPQLEYKRNIGESSLTFLAGATFQQSMRNSSTLAGSGYTNDQLLDNLQAASSIFVVEASNTEYKYNAVFGRLSYALKSRYIFDLIGRRDGSSRFGPDRRFANFGSVSSAWLFGNEVFIRENFRFLSYGKLRASYGTSGNDQIGDYGYLDTFSATSFPYKGVPALLPTRLANPNYSWETNRKAEVGLELGFLNDRILVTTSYYLNRSTDQLVGIPVSAVTGFSSVQANLASTVENKGLEIELSIVNVKTVNFSWSSNINVSLPQNKLIEFKNLESSSYANRFVVGQSVNIDKVYQYLGVDPQAGIHKFKDVDGDQIIRSPFDNQTIVNLSPSLYGGFSNTFQYKNWSMNLFFQFVQQKGPNYLASFNMPGLLRNQPEEVMDRWRNPGDTAPIQRFGMSAGPTFTAFQTSLRSEINYDDASYVRLKNLNISYRFPKQLVQKIKLTSSEIYLQGQNLLTVTSYKGLDPETKSFINLPPLRTITLGLRFTF